MRLFSFDIKRTSSVTAVTHACVDDQMDLHDPAGFMVDSLLHNAHQKYARFADDYALST